MSLYVIAEVSGVHNEPAKLANFFRISMCSCFFLIASRKKHFCSLKITKDG